MDTPRLLFWLCAALCAVAEALILRATFRQANMPAMRDAFPQSPRAVEILWGVLPAFALIAIFWAVWRTFG